MYGFTLHTNSGDSGTDLASYTYEIGAALPLDWTKKLSYKIYIPHLIQWLYSGKAGEKVTQEITLYNKQEDATFTFPELKDLDISDANGYVAYGWI